MSAGDLSGLEARIRSAFAQRLRPLLATTSAELTPDECQSVEEVFRHDRYAVTADD